MAAKKKCSKCGGRNPVDAKKCVKCGESFDHLAPSFVQGSAWSAADQYENPDDAKVSKDEIDPFWRTILIIGIIFTATFFFIGFGIPLLVLGIIGIKKRVTETDRKVKIGIILGSLLLGILVYRFILLPIFT
ncbi:MAG TPA: hypothetical protein DDZ89_17540 [Clostridiales bacterium]|nr:hypothetical protein [Clostridiales bacterium]